MFKKGNKQANSIYNATWTKLHGHNNRLSWKMYYLVSTHSKKLSSRWCTSPLTIRPPATVNQHALIQRFKKEQCLNYDCGYFSGALESDWHLLVPMQPMYFLSLQSNLKESVFKLKPWENSPETQRTCAIEACKLERESILTGRW